MGFFIALQFLTILPCPVKRQFDGKQLGRSQAYFPLVGLFLGLVLVALDTGLRAIVPREIVAGLLLAALAILTGAVHLDGLIDTCDGIFLHRSSADRLAIMRDSRVGSFGVIAAVLVLLLKWATLVALPSPLRIGALMLAPTLGRWAMVYAIAAFPYARQEGKGTVFQGHGRRPVVLATLLALAVAVGASPQIGPALLILATLWAAVFGAFVSGRLAGLTGDSYGALEESTELLILIAFSAVAWRGS